MEMKNREESTKRRQNVLKLHKKLLSFGVGDTRDSFRVSVSSEKVVGSVGSSIFMWEGEQSCQQLARSPALKARSRAHALDLVKVQPGVRLSRMFPMTFIVKSVSFSF